MNNPLTFDRLVAETGYTLFGSRISRIPARNIFRVDYYNPTVQDLRRPYMGQAEFTPTYGRVTQTSYDWGFLSDALKRIVGNDTYSLESINEQLRRELSTGQEIVWVQKYGYRERHARVSIVQTHGFTENQRTKLSEYFGRLENALYEADDDYAFADMYNYSATWLCLLILYVIRDNSAQIRDPAIREMLTRAVTEFATLESYFATIVDAVPLPEEVATAVRERGMNAVIESYMRGFGPRVVVYRPAPARAAAAQV